MPSKKDSTAYRARNARKQADTWIKNLTKVATAHRYTYNQRATARQMVQLLKSLKQDTYKPKGKATSAADAKIEQATAKIKNLANSAKIVKGAKGAANLFTQQQINLASKRYDLPQDNPSMYSQEEVKAFYRATQKIWQPVTKTIGGMDTGVSSTADRNRDIMKALGTNDLSEAFGFITTRPDVQKALVGYKTESGVLDPTSMSDEELELYRQLQGEDTTDSDKGSPNFLAEIVQIGSDTQSLKQLRAEFRAWQKGKLEE